MQEATAQEDNQDLGIELRLRLGIRTQTGNQDSGKELGSGDWKSGLRLGIRTQAGNQDSGKDLRLRLRIRTHTGN
jgi:hypothetical protein